MSDPYSTLNKTSNGLRIGPNDAFQSGKIVGVVTNVMENVTTGEATEVKQQIEVPKGGLGYPIYNMEYLPISNPYQISCISDPAEDKYVSQRVVKYYDFNEILYNWIVDYTYIYYITGVTVLYPQGESKPPPGTTNNPNIGAVRSGMPVYLKEFCLVDCPPTSSCPTEKFPRIVFSAVSNLSFKIDVEYEQNKTCSKIIKYEGMSARMFNFIVDRARDWYSDGEDLTSFQFKMYAYLTVVNMAKIFLPTDPFLSSYDMTTALATQLTYPYMMQANLIMLDGYYAVSGEWTTIYQLAIDFVTEYSKIIWSEANGVKPSLITDFEYSYLEPTYFALYNKIMIQNQVTWNIIKKTN